MKETDEQIKDALNISLTKLDDESFTKRIIDIHLSKQKSIIRKSFFNFPTIVIGLSSVIISIGLSYMISLNNKLVIFDFTFSEQHGVILLLTSLLFVTYKWATDFLAFK